MTVLSHSSLSSSIVLVAFKVIYVTSLLKKKHLDAVDVISHWLTSILTVV